MENKYEIRADGRIVTLSDGPWGTAGTVGIYALNPEPDTLRYRPVDIACLHERWRESNRIVRESLDAFRRHCTIPQTTVRS